MARTRSLLHRVDVRPAGRLAHCAHDRTHEILKGEPRFVIKDPGPAGGEKGYCRNCAKQMLGVAEVQLAALRELLDSWSGTPQAWSLTRPSRVSMRGPGR